MIWWYKMSVCVNTNYKIYFWKCLCQHFWPIACIFSVRPSVIPSLFQDNGRQKEEQNKEVRVFSFAIPVDLPFASSGAHWCTRKLFMKFSGGQCRLTKTPTGYSKGFRKYIHGNQKRTFSSPSIYLFITSLFINLLMNRYK